MSGHTPELVGELARLSWPLDLAFEQTLVGPKLRWTATLAGKAVLPWPILSRPEPLRLSLHDLRQTRRPKRSQSWQAAATRPQLISMRHTREQWRVRLGWYTSTGVRWALLVLERTAGDQLLQTRSGLQLLPRAEVSRQLELSVDSHLVSEPVRPTASVRQFGAGAGELSRLTALVRTTEAEIIQQVTAIEQDYIHTTNQQSRHRATHGL